LLDDPDLFGKLISATLPGAYLAAKAASQEWVPIGDLIQAGESIIVEFEPGLLTNRGPAEGWEVVEPASLKTVAAFLNSVAGGTLILGVADDGTVVGLDDGDGGPEAAGEPAGSNLEQHLTQLIRTSMGDAAATNV